MKNVKITPEAHANLRIAAGYTGESLADIIARLAKGEKEKQTKK